MGTVGYSLVAGFVRLHLMKLLNKFLGVIRPTEIFPQFPCIFFFSESQLPSPVDYTTTLPLAVQDRFHIKHSRLLGFLFQSPSNLFLSP